MAKTSPAADDPSRQQLFEAARRDAGRTVEQLWLDYMALGGGLVVFDLDAYLAGLTPMQPDQQDILACALNERLTDLHQTTRVPYLTALPSWPDNKAVTDLLKQLPGRSSD
jgi:hypothetical protein